MADKRVAIIGAGVGGLATAALLAETGYKVDVYEAQGGPGGRAGQLVHDGFTFDAGPSWYLMPEIFEQFYGLLGERLTDHLKLQRLQPAYKVFYDYHDPVTVRADLEQDAATFEAIEAGAGERLRRYVAQADETYQLSVQHFLANPFRSAGTVMHRDILKRSPQLLGMLNRTLDQHVRRSFSTLPLQQILEYPAVFLGTSPFSAPAIYHLMSTLDFTQGVYYPDGGLYGIARSLEQLGTARGVTFHYGTPVEQILIQDGRAGGLQLGQQKIAADIVISNADRHYTEMVLTPSGYASMPARAWEHKTSGPSALLMYLGVKGSLPELKHHNLIFVEQWRQNFEDIFGHKRWPDKPSMYVCKPSATDASVAPQGHENVFVLVPLPAGGTRPADIEAYTDSCLASIEQHTGISDLRQRIVSRKLFGPDDFSNRFHAWQGSALGLAHTLWQSAVFRPSGRNRKVPNLYYVGGDARPGIGLPMCLISAQLIYKYLTDDRSAGLLTGIRHA